MQIPANPTRSRARANGPNRVSLLPMCYPRGASMRHPDAARERGVVPPAWDREWQTDAVECMGARAQDPVRRRVWSAAARRIGRTVGAQPRRPQSAKRELRSAGKLGGWWKRLSRPRTPHTRSSLHFAAFGFGPEAHILAPISVCSFLPCLMTEQSWQALPFSTISSSGFDKGLLIQPRVEPNVVVSVHCWSSGSSSPSTPRAISTNTFVCAHVPLRAAARRARHSVRAHATELFPSEDLWLATH